MRSLGIVLASSSYSLWCYIYLLEPGKQVKKGAEICDWDPYNAIIVSEFEGKS
jgi:DNA-directed RNA polymerase subunit beta'